MALKRVLEAFASIIHDPCLFPFARIISTSFTREDGKMPLRYLLDYLIFRAGKTLNKDINQFYSNLHIHDRPSKQAVKKRMSILNYAVWGEIQKLFLQRIYVPMKKQTYKGYLLIAVDGTFANLPRDPVLYNVFGCQTSDKAKKHRGAPQAKVSIAYDVLNHVILDFQVAPCATSEIPLLFKHLEALKKLLSQYKVILLADRYYGSTELFKYCEMMGYGYIIRAKKNFFKKQRASITPECHDTWITVLIDKIWQKRILRPLIRAFISIYPVMHVRVVKNHYEYQEEHMSESGKKILIPKSVDVEYFTNLPGKKFAREAIVNLYHIERWDIETEYDTLKNQTDLEEFNSANPIVILNEIMARFIFINVDSLVYMAASKRIRKDTAHIINHENTIEKCRTSWFVRSFFKKKFSIYYARSVIRECSRFKDLIRNDRHLRRWGKFRIKIDNTRYRLDGRRNPPLKLTKAGIMTTNH